MRQQQLAKMFDLSMFVRILKQRFTVWFNRTHSSYGIVWAERFNSVFLDHEGDTARVVAACIDLASVRLALASVP